MDRDPCFAADRGRDREEPDGERAEAGAERGEEEGGGRAGGTREEQSSQVAADAEEGGVAEGHHARVAHEHLIAYAVDFTGVSKKEYDLLDLELTILVAALDAALKLEMRRL